MRFFDHEHDGCGVQYTTVHCGEAALSHPTFGRFEPSVHHSNNLIDRWRRRAKGNATRNDPIAIATAAPVSSETLYFPRHASARRGVELIPGDTAGSTREASA